MTCQNFCLKWAFRDQLGGYSGLVLLILRFWHTMSPLIWCAKIKLDMPKSLRSYSLRVVRLTTCPCYLDSTNYNKHNHKYIFSSMRHTNLFKWVTSNGFHMAAGARLKCEINLYITTVTCISTNCHPLDAFIWRKIGYFTTGVINFMSKVTRTYS